MAGETPREVVGRTYVQLMLSENSAHRLAERASACPSLAEKTQSAFGLLVRVLHGPCQPVVVVTINVVVARGQHFVHVLAHQAPLTALRCDAPSAPKVEFAVDDLRAAGLENQARVLPPQRMMEPPIAPILRTALANVDAPMNIKISKIVEAQKTSERGRHSVRRQHRIRFPRSAAPSRARRRARHSGRR